MDREYPKEFLNMNDYIDVLHEIQKMLSSKEKRIIKYFKIGSLVANKKININTICDILDIKISDMNIILETVARFNYNLDNFKAYLKEHNISNWRQYLDHLFVNSNDSIPLDTIDYAFLIIKKSLNDYLNKKIKNYKSKFINLRDLLCRHLPLESEMFDINYIRYSECIICDTEAPPDGHEIVIDEKYSFMKIPLCRSCIELGRQVDYHKLAAFYCQYAINSEIAYYNIIMS